MSVEVYVVTGIVFFLLMVGIVTSQYRKAKQVDGTLLATALAFAIGIYFIVAIGIQMGTLKEAQSRLQEGAVQMMPGLAAGGVQMAFPTLGGEGVEVKQFPLLGLIAVIVGVIAMGLGAAASRRGDRSAGQTLMVLGIFLIVVAVVVFIVR